MRSSTLRRPMRRCAAHVTAWTRCMRSEEHTSELQSQSNLVCRLLLEKKKNFEKHAQRSSHHAVVHEQGARRHHAAVRAGLKDRAVDRAAHAWARVARAAVDRSVASAH